MSGERTVTGMRILPILAALVAFAAPLGAQQMTALASVDPGPSEISDGWFGSTRIDLHLSQGVPFRVFLLDDPARLVVDFREADWRGVRVSDLLEEPGKVTDLRFGPFQPVDRLQRQQFRVAGARADELISVSVQIARSLSNRPSSSVNCLGL